MKTGKLSAADMTFTALFAAILCISSYISIPLPFSPVSITAQTLIINMIAILFTPKRAAMTVGIWILLGLVGLPVFSGGAGGLAKLAGPTGGYIFGYLAAAILIAFIRGKKGRLWQELLAVTVIGIPVIYLIGMPWMMAVTGIGWKAAFLTGVLPFIPGDVVKAVVSVFLCRPLKGIIRNNK